MTKVMSALVATQVFHGGGKAMQIAVIFESLEGQTKKIAAFVEDRLQKAGHDVQLFDAADRNASLELDQVEKVVLAAPVHERRHPKEFEVLLAAESEALNALPTMMLSVSLKASLKEGMDEAQEYVTEMSMRCGVSFDREVLVAGAVRTESYGYFESQIIHNVVLDGVAVDLVDGVREFTDWTALGDQVDQFVAG